MATYAKYVLNGGSGGVPIYVIAVSRPGTTVHTAPTGTTGMDEIWLWANNTATVSRDIIVSIGTGSTASDQRVACNYTIAANSGPFQVLPGIPINNGANVACVATAADGAILVYGYVNRIAT